MGCNYYWHQHAKCECCGRSYPALHIGKSSAGWCFSLHIHPEKNIHDLGNWRALWKSGGEIQDEYDRKLFVNEMLTIICERSHPEPLGKIPPGFKGNWKQYLRANHAVEGPNNLLRHEIDNHFCVDHGRGTYDLCIGEFS